MKKNITPIACISITASLAAIIISAASNMPIFVNANSNSYGLTLSSTKNKFFEGTGSAAYDGEATLKTDSGNDINFVYSNIAGGSASNWHLIKADGYFYNTTPIHGLDQATFVATAEDKEFTIYWGYDTNYTLGSSVLSSSTAGTEFIFDSNHATYFKVVNTSGGNLSFKNIKVNHTCQTGYLTLDVTSEDETMGTVSGGGAKIAGQSVTIEATPKPGYKFVGWYSDSVLISSDISYTFNVKSEDLHYTAKFTADTYELVLVNDNETLGSISGDGSYLYGSSVTITATPNLGASFIGWYDEKNDLISTDESYTFTMPYEDIVYTSKFGLASYLVSLLVNDNNMGTVIGDGQYTFGQEVNLVATPNEHYSFFGWYDDETLLSKETTYSFNMPAQSLNYTAKFVKNYNLVVYSDDDSMGGVTAPSECGAGFEVTVTANANIGYALDYWADGNYDELSNEITYTFIMPENDVELIACFTTGYTFTINSNDPTKGTVSGEGQYKAGRSVTAAISNITGIFKGWYDGGNNLISTDESYTFTMPANDFTLNAIFMTEQEEWDYYHGITPMVSKDGKTITYGLYPQTNVNDETIINALNELTTPESNGWYLYNNDYYAKLSASPFDSAYKFDNGITIVNGETYWFKCEPIVWNILSNNDGEYYALSSVLLDAQSYYHDKSEQRTINDETVYANNYMYSDIRQWLNDSFYNSAFALDNDNIQTALVVNSSSSPYACDDTLDKVFLPSLNDYSNEEYGFNSSWAYEDQARVCKTSDWTRAKGGYVGDFDGWVASYWTRSPYGRTPYNDGSCAYLFVETGRYGGDFVSYGFYCVRPAILLKI